MKRREDYEKRARVIKAAGLVCDRKQGLQVFYRLRVPCITQFFGCVEAVLDADRQALSCATV